MKTMVTYVIYLKLLVDVLMYITTIAKACRHAITGYCMGIFHRIYTNWICFGGDRLGYFSIDFADFLQIDWEHFFNIQRSIIIFPKTSI